jgi:DNA replication protein DnaC
VQAHSAALPAAFGFLEPLAMLVSKHAALAQRAIAIYSVPRLLSELRKTYDDDSRYDYLDSVRRLASVDLLQLEDVAVARTNEWVLEQLYTIVNDRYMRTSARSSSRRTSSIRRTGPTTSASGPTHA